MDTLISDAERDLAKAEARLARARDEVLRAETDAEQLRTVVAWLRKKFTGHDAEADAAVRGVAKTGSKSAALVSVCLDALCCSTGAMSIAELEAAVVKSGLEIGGTSPRANLAGYLSRDSRVTFERGIGWTLSPAPSRSEMACPQEEKASAGVSRTDGGPSLEGDHLFQTRAAEA